jgi:hypothetical protein
MKYSTIVINKVSTKELMNGWEKQSEFSKLWKSKIGNENKFVVMHQTLGTDITLIIR